MSLKLSSLTRSLAALALPVSLSLLLTACASYGPGKLAPGATVADITARMGKPTNEYTLPDGTRRLEFARGPAGVSTYMLDLDPSGKLKSSRQVLTEEQFAQVKLGITREQLVSTLGRPSQIQGTFRHIDIYNYRYDSIECRLFQVEITPEGRVKSTGYGADPLCTAPEIN